MTVMKGWRYIAFISCIVGGIGLTVYPIILDPMQNADKYKKVRARTLAKDNKASIPASI